MAAGQGPLTGDVDVPALIAAETAVEQALSDRALAHGRRLRAALGVHLAFSTGGMTVAAPAHLALLEQT